MNNTNIPDRWVVLQINQGDKTVNKVFAGWHGGYGGGDSWQLNSGIVDTKQCSDRFEFTGKSGSLYICYKACYGMTDYMEGVLNRWRRDSNTTIKVLEEYDVRSKR